MILSMKEVTYRRQGKNILENISWEFEKGQTWAILGLNGAGKSTLLRILTAEFWKSSGDLSVLGVKFGKGDIPTLRTKIGIVGSFLAERFPTDLLAEQIVLTGKYKSIADLVSFLVWMGEPVAEKRKSIGTFVLIFLAGFFVLAYALKKNYWKDIH